MTSLARISRAATLAAVAALAALPAGPAGAETKRAAPRDYGALVTATEGGHLLGNPQAGTRLVEFMSYTCSHCAEFARVGDGALRLAYVPGGKLSYEIRHLVRDPIDLTAALLTNCGPADKFFANHAAIIARYGEWMPRVAAASQAQRSRWSFGTLGARFQAIASDLGLDDIMLARGYSAVEIARCLSDEAKARAIADTSQADVAKYALQGTPSFLLDGALVEAHSWPELEKLLATHK